jgi:endonuclease G, mitochondrial
MDNFLLMGRGRIFALGLAVGCGTSSAFFAATPTEIATVNVPPQKMAPSLPHGWILGSHSKWDTPLAHQAKIAEFLPFGIPLSDPVIVRDGYISAIDSARRVPRWIAEKLTAAKLRAPAVSRKNARFEVDQDLHPLHASTLDDYYRSGYDRGHLIPAADAKWSEQAMNDTFKLTTNVAPQEHIFNAGLWARFEDWTRKLAFTYDAVYVYSGVLFKPAIHSNGEAITEYAVLGNPPNTAVPTHFYKVILVEDQKATPRWRMGIFVMPNRRPTEEDRPLTSFEVSEEQLTRDSGVLFFPNLDRRQLGSLCRGGKVPCHLATAKQWKEKYGGKNDSRNKGGAALKESPNSLPTPGR